MNGGYWDAIQFLVNDENLKVDVNIMDELYEFASYIFDVNANRVRNDVKRMMEEEPE